MRSISSSAAAIRSRSAGVRRRAAAIDASISMPRRTSSVRSSASRQAARLDRERQVHRPGGNRLEDVGAAADPRLQHAERLQLAHGLAHAGAPDPERLHQLPLGRKAVAGPQTAPPRCNPTAPRRPAAPVRAAEARRAMVGDALVRWTCMIPRWHIRRQTNPGSQEPRAAAIACRPPRSLNRRGRGGWFAPRTFTITAARSRTVLSRHRAESSLVPDPKSRLALTERRGHSFCCRPRCSSRLAEMITAECASSVVLFHLEDGSGERHAAPGCILPATAAE